MVSFRTFIQRGAESFGIDKVVKLYIHLAPFPLLSHLSRGFNQPAVVPYKTAAWNRLHPYKTDEVYGSSKVTRGQNHQPALCWKEGQLGRWVFWTTVPYVPYTLVICWAVWLGGCWPLLSFQWHICSCSSRVARLSVTWKRYIPSLNFILFLPGCDIWEYIALHEVKWFFLV